MENLDTKDLTAAERLAPAADARLRATLAAAEAAQHGQKASLSDRQVAALAGVWYQRELVKHGNRLGSDPDG
jgi:hypothetical protein